MNRTIFRTSILCVSLFCISCSSRYAPYSGGFLWIKGSGYDEVQVNASKWRVTFAGNSWTSPEIVDRYALYRAAELTEQQGYDYFFVVDAAKDADVTISSSGNSSTSVNQFGAAAASNSQTSSSTVYSTIKVIQMYKGKSDNPNAYDAHLMVKSMASKIDR